MKVKIRKYFYDFERETYADDLKKISKIESYLDCSLGLNPYGCSELALDNRNFDAELIKYYPKYSKERIIDYWKDVSELTPSNIFFDAGSFGNIERINKLFVSEKTKVLGYCPQFTDYILDVKSCGGNYEYMSLEYINNYKFDIKEMLSRISDEYNLIYIDNPNNPTGQVIDLSEIYQIVKKAQELNIAVLVDESYGDFMNRSNSAISLINKFENLFVTRSFSKGYGLAGLRIGYLVMSKELHKYYAMVSHPFPANALGLYYAHKVLEDSIFIERSKELIRTSKLKLLETCQKMLVLETDLSVPIMILRHPDKEINLYEEFLQRGIITFSGHHFIGLEKNYVRIRIPTEEDLKRLIEGVKEIERGII